MSKRKSKREIAEKFIAKYVQPYCKEKIQFDSFTCYRVVEGKIRHWNDGEITFDGMLSDYEMAYSCMVMSNKGYRFGETPF